ncbi:DUF4302 domain-containing protein [Sphingobacterium paucimobilis]|uniref:DUF4302 domain-containing protein n=1 Tax=Sphingobacterium paucimobilis HER1398 TaxID=1346330 RepID=U2HWH5_9SPHI|nr:DUF4302 domain-containing protein [Sphingobacterium paucimobilis]ERJ59892.1 hypothetical protein M472_14060 [Sphingobacterium paucimobilis HER1398]
MKNIITTLLAIFFVALSSCDKEIKLPAREIAPSVAKVAEEYTDILVKRKDGWLLTYTPNSFEEPLYFHLTFKDSELIDIQSGYRDFHDVQSNVSYYFEGKYTPILVFSGENVFTTLADIFDDTNKFKIYYKESENRFEFVRADGFAIKAFDLVPANEHNLMMLSKQVNQVLAEIEFEKEQLRLSEVNRLKIEKFVEIQSDFFFYNLIIDDFSAAIQSFDTLNNKITLSYKETATSSPTKVTLNYNLTPEGINLKPALKFGDKTIEVIRLGDLVYNDLENPERPTSLALLDENNVVNGFMGYSHLPPYPFTNTIDRTKTAAFLLEDDNSNHGILQTTIDEMHYSTKAREIREEFKQFFITKRDSRTDTFFDFNVYLYDATGAKPSFGLKTGNPAGTGVNYYFLNLETIEEHLYDNVLNFEIIGSRATVTNNPSILVEYSELFRKFFPEEGVTVVPHKEVGQFTQFKLVSRKDSRIWVNYSSSTATPNLRNVSFD